MLIKEKDPVDKAIHMLEEIKQIPNLPKDALARVEKELKTFRAGNDGESNSAYYIDFYFRNSPNTAIIHDLRLEYRGNIAQIDHVLINRLLDFYVLETKSYSYGLKVNEHGEFAFWDGHRYIGIESPIEQNKRHVFVLEQVLKDKGLLPTRLGFVISPSFKPYVLVAPKSNVIRPKTTQFNTDMIIKADILHQQYQTDFDNVSTAATFGSLAKMISSEALKEMAQRLIRYHTPAEIDYYAKFGIQPVAQGQPQVVEPTEMPAPASMRTQSKYYCFKCHEPITQRVAQYCFDRKERFGGKAYCMEHQKEF